MEAAAFALRSETVCRPNFLYHDDDDDDLVVVDFFACIGLSLLKLSLQRRWHGRYVDAVYLLLCLFVVCW